MLSSTFPVALDSHPDPLDVQVARHKPQGIIFLLNARFKPTLTCEGEEEEGRGGGGERGRREEGGRGRRERRQGGGRRDEEEGGQGRR